jgi:hypothetical protein
MIPAEKIEIIEKQLRFHICIYLPGIGT